MIRPESLWQSTGVPAAVLNQLIMMRQVLLEREQKQLVVLLQGQRPPAAPYGHISRRQTLLRLVQHALVCRPLQPHAHGGRCSTVFMHYDKSGLCCAPPRETLSFDAGATRR